jgi:hypothetical protein
MSLLSIYTTIAPSLLLILTCLLLMVFALAMALFNQRFSKILLPYLAIVNILLFYKEPLIVAFPIAFVSGCLAAFCFKRKHFGSIWLYYLAMVALGPALNVGIVAMIWSAPEVIHNTNLTLHMTEVWNLLKPMLIPAVIWAFLITATQIQPVKTHKWRQVI